MKSSNSNMVHLEPRVFSHYQGIGEVSGFFFVVITVVGTFYHHFFVTNPVRHDSVHYEIPDIFRPLGHAASACDLRRTAETKIFVCSPKIFRRMYGPLTETWGFHNCNSPSTYTWSTCQHRLAIITVSLILLAVQICRRQRILLLTVR